MPKSIETQLGLLEETIGTLLTADTTDRRGHLQGELQKGFKALRGLLDVQGGVGKGPVYTPVRLDAPPPSADPTDEVQCLGISAPADFPAQRKRSPKPLQPPPQPPPQPPQPPPPPPPQPARVVSLYLEIPAGNGVGDKLQIETPLGPFNFVVPSGAAAGKKITISLPAPPGWHRHTHISSAVKHPVLATTTAAIGSFARVL